MTTRTAKTVQHIIKEARPHWVGDGFNVTPVFNDLAFSEHLSPFLMFDYGFPKEFKATHAKQGVGMHPHRGFETITIAYQGEIEHKDNKGNTGIIGPGDVQWMTAGNGIFHEEFHSQKFRENGGTLEMCQLWVNLPSHLKMVKPRYQDILAGNIPQTELPHGGHLRVISGDYKGIHGVAKTEFEGQKPRGTVELWDILVKAGTTVEIDIPKGNTCIAFVRAGDVLLGVGADKTPLKKARAALLGGDGVFITIEAQGNRDAQLLFLGGEPIVGEDGKIEPIVNYGPMVMNTKEEIMDAMQWAQREQSKYY